MKYRLGFIGCGNMAGAILSAVTEKGVFEKSEIVVYDVNVSATDRVRSRGFSIAESASEVASQAEFILLGVKPNIVPSVAEEIKSALTNESAVISIAAGVKIGALKKYFGEVGILRVMPNLPALVGEGATALCTEHTLTDAQWQTAQRVFNAVGKTFLLEEKHMDTVTALTGSGPAIAFMFVDALADAAVLRGIPKAVATEMAVQMVLGSAKLLSESDESPAEWKDKVCSPGGTTIEAVSSLHRSGFMSSVMDAVLAAAEKSEKLGK